MTMKQISAISLIISVELCNLWSMSMKLLSVNFGMFFYQ